MSHHDRREGVVATITHNLLHIINVSKPTVRDMGFTHTTVQFHKDFIVSIVNHTHTEKHFIIVGDFNNKHTAWNDGPENSIPVREYCL